MRVNRSLFIEDIKLEDLKAKTKRLNPESQRHVWVFAVGVAKEGLANARETLGPGNVNYKGVEDVCGKSEWEVSGLPRCLSKADVINTILRIIGWKTLAGKVVTDKEGRGKSFWKLRADGPPKD